jgi:PAS domain S-box-containing protein
MLAAVAMLFILAMAGLLWQVFSLSDNFSHGLVLQGTELRIGESWREGDVRGVLEVVRPLSENVSHIYGQLQQTFLLLGVVGMAGLSGLALAVVRMRRSARALEHLITEQTAKLAAATQQANQMAQAKAQILSTVDAFFIGVDASGAVCEWTGQAEQLFGIPLPEVVGRTFREISIRWNWELILEAITRAINELSTIRLGKVPFRTHEDRQRFLKLTVSPLCKDSGVEAVIMGEDITERLLLEHDLMQTQKLESIGQLAAGIAHEINTPIQFVGDNIRFLSVVFTDLRAVLDRYQELLMSAKSGNCSPALIKACEAETQRTDLDYVTEEIPTAIAQTMEGVERIAKIVRAMKDFAHPGSEEKAPANLNAAIESTVTVSRNEWKYVADLKTDLAPDLPPVPCLVSQLNQAILNMIVNAVHAIADTVKVTGQKGLITIVSRRDGNNAEIRITDTGTGIPDDIRPKIFDPFFTTKEVGKGTGQGLAIARSVVVDKHQGAIAVESEVGKGTTFIIRLPLFQAGSHQDRKRAT